MVFPGTGSEVCGVCRLWLTLCWIFCPGKGTEIHFLLYMPILALAGAASLCTPGTILKRDPSVGGHPDVCGAVRLCAWKYQRCAAE